MALFLRNCQAGQAFGAQIKPWSDWNEPNIKEKPKPLAQEDLQEFAEALSSRQLNQDIRRTGTMIEEMSQVLQQKAGLSPEQANEVSQIVLDHVKSKVPPQFQSFLNPILGGSQPAADGQPAASGGGLGGLLGAASSLFGGKS